jgi:hypothetical protein
MAGCARKALHLKKGLTIPLNLAGATSVRFYYDNKTHWVTDNQNSIIATVPGNFQSELGCPGDWDPGAAPGRADLPADR